MMNLNNENILNIDELKKIYLKIKESIPNIKLKLAGASPGKEYFKNLPEVEFLPFLNDIEFKDYVSEEAITKLIKGGCRFIDLDIFDNGFQFQYNREM